MQRIFRFVVFPGCHMKPMGGTNFLICPCGFGPIGAKKSFPIKDRKGRNLVVPPFFISSSHCPSQRVSDNTPALITCTTPSQPMHPLRARCFTAFKMPGQPRGIFGVKLGDVFVIRFLRTSHQPVTFCSFHLFLLVPVKAYACFN